MHVLISGGCGFIGSNFVKLLLGSRPAWRLTVLDALSCAGNLAALREVARAVAPWSRLVAPARALGSSSSISPFLEINQLCSPCMILTGNEVLLVAPSDGSG